MARKRKIESIEKDDPSEKPDEVDRPRHTESWPMWIRNEFLRYWYLVGCIFVDSITFLQIYLTPDRPIILAMAVLIGLVILEIFVYRKIWARNKDLGREED